MNVFQNIRQIPRLNTIEIWYSRYIENPESSTLFHTDTEYSKQAKLFIYGSDVLDDNSGPFNLYDRENSKKAMKYFNYQSNKSIDTHNLRKYLGGNNLISIRGYKGTAFLADTCNIFHSGSLVKDKSSWRITIMFQYLPYLSYKKWYDFSHLIKPNHSKIQKLVLDSKGVGHSLFKGNLY